MTYGLVEREGKVEIYDAGFNDRGLKHKLCYSR